LTNNQYFDKKINIKYKDKTKEQRINELAELHQRIEDLEAEATKRKKAEESLPEALKELRFNTVSHTAGMDFIEDVLLKTQR